MPQILAKNKVMMKVHVGEAELDDTENITLFTTLHGAPIITFEDNTTIYWTWEELIEQAIKLKESKK